MLQLLVGPPVQAPGSAICAGRFREAHMTTEQMGYPLTYDVEYPEGALSRLGALFRIILVIPIEFLSVFLAGTITIPLVLMILFRQKYPRWWFDFNLERARFAARVNVYFHLMTDQYPSTDEAQSVSLDMEYPDAAGLNRFLPLIKWLLAIPHYVVLVILFYVSLLLLLIAWIVIILTGRYPRGLFDFQVGYQRWNARVNAYAFALITDRYPPFSMS